MQYRQERARQLGVAIVIPTYNNATTLSAVIEEVCRYASDIIIVNDGSTDDTADILASYANNIQILTHARNKGKGTALRNGLSHARNQGFRYAITIDSDGQHYPSDIPLFIEEIEKEPEALLVGARNLQADNMPGKNTFANKFSNFWFRLETGIRLEDTQSGYRLYPLQQMGSMKYYTGRYEFELEAIVFAAWRGVKVKNVPIHVYYPPEVERVSHFRPLRDFTRISILNTCLVLWALLWIWPRNFFRKFTRKNIRGFFNRYILNSPESNLQLTFAIMLGIFMGIVPVWGYQMIIALFLSRVLRLNSVVTLLASNISIPPMMPFILYGSYATGCIILGRPVSVNFGDLSFENIKTVLEQYILGSFIFAILCSLLAGVISWSLLTLFRHKSYTT